MNPLSSSVRRRCEGCLVGYNSPAMPDAITGKILIVDDDEGVTQTFARMLPLEGYQVGTPATAETGLQEAQPNAPDAISLDPRMPLVDGLGFLRRLRAQDEQRMAPVAIVTGD